VTHFAQACGVHDAPRAAACEAAMHKMRESGLERVRIAWCDMHGVQRGKTLMPGAAVEALFGGVSMVSTILLKDTSDRTAYPVFEPGAFDELPGFGQANNLVLLPDPASLCELPWASGTGWMRSQAWFADATPVPVDPRRVLQAALATLNEAGFGLQCGLEVEFHIHRIVSDGLDPQRAAWPGEPPEVALLHPGYNLLTETHADMAEPALRIVQSTAQALGLPLRSLEIELGPSQVEAVFDPTDALTAADQMVLFRNGVRQALRRAGYYASFVCLPPFPNAMASGWHLHQSLTRLADGGNAFMRAAQAPGTTPSDALHTLSDVGAHWLGGLLAHARGAAVFGTPTINGYGRFRPNAMAPQSVLWGRDNRGAMLRVLGASGDAATRIENRVGEPMANPYLYIASQIHCGLSGLRQRLDPGRATDSPYGQGTRLPASLGEALEALQGDATLREAFGAALSSLYARIKRSELERHAAAQDPDEWMRREYFGRF
jgi:glutamine synthetase